MAVTAVSRERVEAALSDAIGVLGLVEPDRLDPADSAALLLELRRFVDRAEGEFARLATAVEESGEWSRTGASSMPAWLSKQTGMARGRARAAVELGSAMALVPPLERAVRSGDLSPTAAAAVIPAVDDDGFADVADRLIAEMSGMTPTAAGRHIEQWRAVTDTADDTTRRAAARERRALRFWPAGDGMEHVEGIIPTGVARELRLAVSHLAEGQRCDGTDRTREQRGVDALGDLAAAYNRGEVTGGRNLPRVIVTMTIDDLDNRCGVAIDAFGGVVTSTEIDRLCCDAVIHRYVADQTGTTLNFGRGRRTVSPHQFLALVARDGGCRHPACDRPPGWCEAHHLREFAARGGLTDLDEMALLCHHHHHALHDGGWSLAGDPTHLIFTGPDGRVLHSSLPRHDTTRVAA